MNTDLDQPKIALALSGGGFRATLFHTGALWRINELGLIPRLSAISAVSGGALLAGIVGIKRSQLKFRNNIADNYADQIVEPIFGMCDKSIDVATILSGPFIGTRLLEKFYEKHLVGRSTLQDLPDYPVFIFSAYHLETGRNCRFTKKRMHIWRIGDVERPTIPMTKVLAASSAFPPALPPVRLRFEPSSFREIDIADHFHDRRLREKVTLGDGGVYDNLGLHSIRESHHILVSNGSSPLSVEPMPRWKVWRNRGTRPINTAVEQTRALRITNLMDALKNGNKKGALWMISTDIGNYQIKSPFDVDPRWPGEMSRIRTRLNRFTDEEKQRLVNWGYIQADLSIRDNYLSNLTPPTSLPFPDFGFESI